MGADVDVVRDIFRLAGSVRFCPALSLFSAQNQSRFNGIRQVVESRLVEVVKKIGGTEPQYTRVAPIDNISCNPPQTLLFFRTTISSQASRRETAELLDGVRIG